MWEILAHGLLGSMSPNGGAPQGLGGVCGRCDGCLGREFQACLHSCNFFLKEAEIHSRLFAKVKNIE